MYSSKKPVDFSCDHIQSLCVAVPLSSSPLLIQLIQTLYHTFWSILWFSTEAEDLCLFYIKTIQIHCPGFLLLLQRQITFSAMHLKQLPYCS